MFCSQVWVVWSKLQLAEASGSPNCCFCEDCSPSMLLLFPLCSVVVEPNSSGAFSPAQMPCKGDVAWEGGAEGHGVLKLEAVSSSGAMCRCQTRTPIWIMPGGIWVSFWG